MIKTIGLDGQIIAHIYDLRQIDKSSFPTPDQLPFQFGVGVIEEEKKIERHFHRPIKRTIEGTAEFIFVIEGRIDIDIFAPDHSFLQTVTLAANQSLLQFKGGHEMLMFKDTKYFELKQGPYLGADRDKYYSNV